jgi:hypothetical protein
MLILILSIIKYCDTLMDYLPLVHCIDFIFQFISQKFCLLMAGRSYVIFSQGSGGRITFLNFTLKIRVSGRTI